MAMPPLKYSGLYSSPSFDSRHPTNRLRTRNDPPGVIAVSQAVLFVSGSSTQKSLPDPEEIDNSFVSALPR